MLIFCYPYTVLLRLVIYIQCTCIHVFIMCFTCTLTLLSLSFPPFLSTSLPHLPLSLPPSFPSCLLPLQTEIAKRLNAICAQVIPFLSQEHQQQVAAAVERAKQVTTTELHAIIGVRHIIIIVYMHGRTLYIMFSRRAVKGL